MFVVAPLKIPSGLPETSINNGGYKVAIGNSTTGFDEKTAKYYDAL